MLLIERGILYRIVYPYDWEQGNETSGNSGVFFFFM